MPRLFSTYGILGILALGCFLVALLIWHETEEQVETPPPAAPTARSVVITTARDPDKVITDLSFGSYFRVRITFDQAPVLDEERIVIRAKRAGDEIELVAKRSSESPIVFVTDPVRLMPAFDGAGEK